jgi:CubicO group peptidase (beta-lactamase class C family)
MTATTWDVDGLDPRSGRSARGYRAEQGAFVAEDLLPDGAFGPMGGLATSIVDFSKYVAAHLRAWPPRDGPETGPLRRSSMREMAQIWRSFPAAADSGVLAAGYGYGWRVETRARFGTVVAHSGGLPGFGSHVAFLPDHGVGVVAFANRTYAKVRLAVDVALEALADTGGLAPRVSGPSSALELARERVTGLYEHWDDGLAHDSLLGTALLDRDDERRWPDLLALRSRFGACLESGPIAATGALRGSWPMRCALGTFELEVLLGPMPDGRIQFLEVRE